MTDDRVRRLELDNEILRLEVEALRRRVEGSTESEVSGGASIDEAELEALRRARKDLRWLLRRLGKGPVGWVLRRTSGYRTLARRHLGPGEVP